MSTHPARRPPNNPVYCFHCPHCRRQVLVHPNQAGGRLDCMCGQQNVVPSIMQLSRLDDGSQPQSGGSPFAGQPANAASPPPPGTQGVPPCPFCRAPLEAGRIIGERYQLKWLRIDVPLTLGIWAMGGLPIGHGGFMQFNRPHVYGWRCANCCKIIVDERA